MKKSDLSMSDKQVAVMIILGIIIGAIGAWFTGISFRGSFILAVVFMFIFDCLYLYLFRKFKQYKLKKDED